MTKLRYLIILSIALLAQSVTLSADDREADLMCRTVDFLDITSQSPIQCTDLPITLTATPFSGGVPMVDDFITPAFGVQITTDSNSTQENWLEIWDGPSAMGERVAYWGPIDLGGNYLGTLPSDSTFIGFGEYFDPGGFYSIEWCDVNGTGIFNYSVIDFSDGSIMNSGSFNHAFQNCFITNVGAPGGTATFSGPGVTDFGNGYGEFDPSLLASGFYDITYTWDDGDGCSGSSVQQMEVVCPCPNVGFNDIASNSPFDCNSGLVSLTADNSIIASGFITPGFTIEITTDVVALLQNSLEIFDGPNGTGNPIAFYPIGSVAPSTNWQVMGEYANPGTIYSFIWCDNENDGIFPFNIVDHGSGTQISSGALFGSAGCTTINFGPLTGISTFSGPGVTNLNNGTGYFDPGIAGNGMHTITYEWTGTNCSGTSSQTIEVTGCQIFTCTAQAGTFNTPNGLVICYGSEFSIQTNWDFDGPYETGDLNDVYVPDGTYGPPDGVADADGDGINGVVYGVYNNPPSPYLINDISSGNFVGIIGSHPDQLQGNGKFLNNVGGNIQYWVTTSYAFDEDLDGSGTSVLGFDDGGDGTINCFNTNQLDAVQITFLNDITATITQVCDPGGMGVDVSLTVTGGLPNFDGSQFFVNGSGGFAIMNDNDTYLIDNHPFGSAFAVSVNDQSGCQKVFTGTALQPQPSDGETMCLGAAGAVVPTVAGDTYYFNNHCFPADAGDAPTNIEYAPSCFPSGDELNTQPTYFMIQTEVPAGSALEIEFRNINMLNGDELQAALYGPISTCPTAGSYPSVVDCYEGNSDEVWNLNNIEPGELYMLVMDSKGTNSGSWNVDVRLPPVITVCPTFFLEGSFNPVTDMPSNRMRTTLTNRGLMQLQQPYNIGPWNYSGTESFNTAGDIPADMVDWVLVVIRDGADPGVVLGRAAGILRTDGTVTTVNGNNVPFGNTSLSGVYVEVIHYNHLPVISASAIMPDAGGNVCYDFTTAMNQAFRDLTQNDDPQKEMFTAIGPFYVLATGNIQSLDCFVDLNDVNLLFMDYNSNPYYGRSDLNMDGQVDANDLFLLFTNFDRNCHRNY